MKLVIEMKKKEDLRIVKTKASLYRGLMSLMKEKPFEEIKVAEICSKSLINRSTFYDHFNDKYELLESLINDLKEELISSLSIDYKKTNIREYYLEMLEIMLDHIDKNKDIYSAIAKINSNSIARDMMGDTILKMVTKEVNKKYKNVSNIPTRTLVLFYTTGIMNVIYEALDTTTFNKKQLLETISALLPDFSLFKIAN